MSEKFEYGPGDRLAGKRGQYRVKSQLGAGGMGACYLVEDTDAPRQYVAKVIHSSLLENRGALDAFNLEGRGLIALHACPQIVQAFHLDATEAGVPFYLMEVLTGRTLRAALTGAEGRRMRLDPDTACGIGLGIATALVFAHGKQVVHCDLKPENVMLVQATQAGGTAGVKLLDFGVMKGMLIQSGYQGAGGTPAYMAPEQLRREDVDARADIFAFGLLLYEMIAGKHPFQTFGLGLKGAVARIDARPPPIASLELGIQDEVARFLDDVIEKLVEPDKKKRCDDASFILVKLTEAKRLIASRIAKRNVHAATTNPGAPSPELIAHVTGAVDEATVAPGTDPDLDVHRVDADALPTSSTLPSVAAAHAARPAHQAAAAAGIASTLPPSTSVPEPTRDGVAYVEREHESHRDVAAALALVDGGAPPPKRTPPAVAALPQRTRAPDTVVEPPDYHRRLERGRKTDSSASRTRGEQGRRPGSMIVTLVLGTVLVVAIWIAYYLATRPPNSAAPAPALSQTSQAR